MVRLACSFSPVITTQHQLSKKVSVDFLNWIYRDNELLHLKVKQEGNTISCVAAS